MSNEDYYLPAIVLAIGFLARMPVLIRDWRSPMARSVSFLVAMASAGFALAAPPTITVINRWTGISNFSAPLCYVILCGFSASCLVLLIRWRDKPGAARQARIWKITYGAVCLLLIITFALGEAPVERLRDLDTYYANTPFIREMISLYLVGHIVAAIATTATCWHWLRETTTETTVGRWLRTGLAILSAGFATNLAYGFIKFSAVVARWTGRDWDALSTSVAPPVVSVGGVMVAVGFLTPLAGPWVTKTIWRPWRTYHRLAPLWRAVHLANPAKQMLASTRAPFFRGDMRSRLRLRDVQDGILQLRKFCDDRIRADAQLRAQDTHPERTAAAIGIAAMLTAALEARATTGEVDEEVSSAAVTEYIAATRAYDGLLVDVSEALRHPIVTAAREQAALTGSSAA